MSTFELDILSFDGAFGVGRFNGRKIKVANTVPGDRWQVRFVHRGRKADVAEGLELLRSSSDRVKARCSIQSECGACPWQVVEPGAQRRHKLMALQEQLDGLVPSKRIQPVVPLSDYYNYRTKSHMPAGGVGQDLTLGFWAKRSRSLVAAPECVVQSTPIERARQMALKALRTANVASWDAATGRGELRSILVRSVNSGESSCQIGIVLVVADSDRRDWEALGRVWVEEGWVHAVWLNIHVEPTNAMLGPDTQHLAGNFWLEQHVGELRVYRGATAFTQSSEFGELELTRIVGRMLPNHIQRWLDLYAGAGIFTAALYPRLMSGVLIERVASGLWAAEKTFAGMSNITMKTGNVEDRLEEVLAQGVLPDAILVDPPRSGLHSKVVEALCAQPTRNLVYVSCQSKTLARDLKWLTQSAFDVVEVVPVDMFPHTPHVEVVTHLQPKSC